MDTWIKLAIAFLGALGLALLATPFAGWLGQRLRILAVPGGRRLHARPVSRLGGIGLFVGFFGMAAALTLWAPLPERLRLPVAGVLAGTLFVFLAGLVDDKRELKALPQFAVQAVAAGIAIVCTVWIQEVTLPIFGFKIFPWYVAVPITLLWVMGMMNTVNFTDGLDGLAAGAGAIAALLFAYHSLKLGQPEIALYSAALAGACLGFLPFNFFPARVFLGSAGAMVLGYAIATLSILAPARVMTALMIMAIPITDTAFQIIDRWRRGRPPTQGDRGHLHYRMLDIGLSQRQIVVAYWLFCAVFGILALTISAPLYKLIALGILGLAVILILLRLSRRKSAPPPPDAP
jgi:UDP-GlcNAc:undecaprenyl-phosphate/decaprenyl-phosphate GlcNAc-1-phosphate transferase